MITTRNLSTHESYSTEGGHFQHWRSHQDRRFWWICVNEEIIGNMIARSVMDDFGNLVRVSEFR